MSTYTFVGASAVGQLDTYEAPIPTPGDGEVLIKVDYSTLGPFDLYNLDRGFYVREYPHRFGCNAAGTIEKVGANVEELKVGDRVISFTAYPPNKGLQAYTVQTPSLVAKIPEWLSFVEGVTLPDNFVTAFYTLFNQLGLPIPTEFPSKSTPPKSTTPILIYGAGTTSGQYMVQLLNLAGYKNVIATASKHHENFLLSMGATHVFDYRSSSLVDDVIKAAGGKVELVVDCASLSNTFATISKIIAPSGTLAFLAPLKLSASLSGEDGELPVEIPEELQAWFPKGVSVISVKTFFFQKDERLANTLVPVVLRKMIEDKLIQPNRICLVNQGDILTRVKDAFELVRSNKVSGQKVVVKVPV